MGNMQHWYWDRKTKNRKTEGKWDKRWWIGLRRHPGDLQWPTKIGKGGMGRWRRDVFKIFWSIELNDLWSKKICWPKVIVWSGATFTLRWFCYVTVFPFQEYQLGWSWTIHGRTFFRCANISWFQVVNKWVIHLFQIINDNQSDNQ